MNIDASIKWRFYQKPLTTKDNRGMYPHKSREKGRQIAYKKMLMIVSGKMCVCVCGEGGDGVIIICFCIHCVLNL